MTREEQENAIRCLKIWIEREPYIQTYKTCLEALEQESKTEKVFKMRDATPEERESIDKYIKSINKPTGVEFDEEQEQIDFVRPHKRIPVTLTVSGYDKLIDLANAIENDDSGYWTNKKISSALKNIISDNPKKPQKNKPKTEFWWNITGGQREDL